MNDIKSWVHIVCVILVLSSAMKIILPSSKNALFKAVLSLFLIVSVIIPFTNGNMKFTLPKMNFEEYSIEEKNNVIENSIINQISNILVKNNYNSCVINCDVSIDKNNDITVNSIDIYIPDEYKADEVKNLIFDSLGYVARVEKIGG